MTLAVIRVFAIAIRSYYRVIAFGWQAVDQGILRVWQKQGGDWKVAASFVHPYDE